MLLGLQFFRKFSTVHSEPTSLCYFVFGTFVVLPTNLSSGCIVLVVCRICESFNDWGGRGCRKYVPFWGGDGTKIAPPGDIFDQPPGEMT